MIIEIRDKDVLIAVAKCKGATPYYEHLSIVDNEYYITLKNCQIYSILFNSDIAHKIVNLNLDNNELKKFPLDIFKLVNLEYLSISNNYIKHIPTKINELTNLILLSLTDNLIQSLPLHIRNLHHITYIQLKNNPIRKIPLDFYNIDSQYCTMSPEELSPKFVSWKSFPNLDLSDISHSNWVHLLLADCENVPLHHDFPEILNVTLDRDTSEKIVECVHNKKLNLEIAYLIVDSIGKECLHEKFVMKDFGF